MSEILRYSVLKVVPIYWTFSFMAVKQDVANFLLLCIVLLLKPFYVMFLCDYSIYVHVLRDGFQAGELMIRRVKAFYLW